MSRQSIPSGWAFNSCFIDNTSAGRLLTVNSGLAPDTMTVGQCIEYCSSNNWAYAGVEYASECYCDQVLHEVGSQVTATTDCNMPCTGDPSQTCGGPNLIDVYWDGDSTIPSSPPTLYKSYWSYRKHRDDTSQRTLSQQVQPYSGSVSPPSCADTCAFYGYTVMGTEFGGECWCGNSTGPASQVPDTECGMTCTADRDYLCGDANRLSVYQNTPPEETYTGECLDLDIPTWVDISNFTVLAIPKEGPTASGGWEGSSLHIIDVLVEGDTTYSLLSACQDCNVTWLGLSFSGEGAGYLIPSSPNRDGAAPMLSLNLVAGESVRFQTQATITSIDYPNFCTSANPYPAGSSYSPTDDGPVLQGDYHADAWAMCPNTSAVPNDRLDLVSQPQVGHADYNVEECILVDVWVQVKNLFQEDFVVLLIQTTNFKLPQDGTRIPRVYKESEASRVFRPARLERQKDQNPSPVGRVNWHAMDISRDKYQYLSDSYMPPQGLLVVLVSHTSIHMAWHVGASIYLSNAVQFLCVFRGHQGVNISVRQTDIPTGWYPYSCFIDNTSAGRLLTTNSDLPSSTMTKVVCIEYCAANNWTYAGVEDGGECFRLKLKPASSASADCDELFHEDGWQGTDSSECNMPCNGDPTQTCGGPNRIDVYWDGDFYTPSSPSTLSRSYWSYSGCFEDSPSQRTLSAQESTFGGVTPATCADACAFNGYTIMGTEYGGECWCGNSTGTAAQVSDTECAMTCNADRDYLCGDANRLSVYHHNPPPPEMYTNQCILEIPTWLNSSHFSLLANPKEPSTSGSGWDGAILRIIDVLTVEDTTWSILSACQACNTTWLDLSFSSSNGGSLIPESSYLNGVAPMISLDLISGESVIFQTQSTLPVGYNGYTGYCASDDPYPPEQSMGNSPTDGPVLLGNGHADDWAMCLNSTAFPVNRLDLIFQPKANHPNYNLEECIAVDLWLE
ncbi:WSC domain-containing protein [Lentinula edodes]|uniref:WSC domain-containing protein n=1 Tax=Lentinula edodes TaxID=5353 RepID=UPI001E8CA0A5|nr:WSC domain-containing protein [Lentinula edodes]KAH7871900.1 WSC domain-containing protein [Lentinula edodes]